MRRRDFLVALPAVTAGGVGALSGLANAAPHRRLRILMLGGTNYVGPHLVRTALDRGHEVTLFNRGITNPHLFPELEKLRGNRYPDRDHGLRALETSRTWDAVLDTWQEAAGCVDLTARMLAERAERYVYISSIATFRHYRESGMTEEGPLLDATEHVRSFDHPGPGYALRKRAGEQAVGRAFGERGIVLRCTSIQGLSGFGRGPATGTEPGYWPYRFLIGEPMLAPDDPTAAFQLIDVKDLARFAIRAVERGFVGAYNMVGPAEPLTLPEYLRAWSEATDHRSPLVWADPDWLREQGVRPWEDIRNWIPGDDPEPGFYRISARKAVAHGLSYRPLARTIHDMIASTADPARFEPPATGLSRERERELIERWRGTGGPA